MGQPIESRLKVIFLNFSAYNLLNCVIQGISKKSSFYLKIYIIIVIIKITFKKDDKSVWVNMLPNPAHLTHPSFQLSPLLALALLQI